MSLNNIDFIQIVPIPGNQFTDNTITINTPINDNSYNYSHVGEYIASSSSWSSDKTMAKNAFNIKSNDSWQCDYGDNSNYDKYKNTYTKYTQNPYIKSRSGPSSYQINGGGTINTAWKTTIGKQSDNNIVYGEWLQIKIPAEMAIYLFKYTILTPPPINNVITFPKSFIILGSNDGNNWNYLDQQIIKNPINTANRIPVTFNINSVTKYSYFRMIITSLFQGNDIISINQWALYGTVDRTINRDATEEFSTMTELTQTPLTPYGTSGNAEFSLSPTPMLRNGSVTNQPDYLPVNNTLLNTFSYYKNSITIDKSNENETEPDNVPYSGYVLRSDTPTDDSSRKSNSGLNIHDESLFIYILIPVLATSILLYRIFPK